MTCPFCERILLDNITERNDLAAAFPDGYPVSDGHTLIVPKRHEADFFQLTPSEQEAILDLARLVTRLRRFESHRGEIGDARGRLARAGAAHQEGGFARCVRAVADDQPPGQGVCHYPQGRHILRVQSGHRRALEGL